MRTIEEVIEYIKAKGEHCEIYIPPFVTGKQIGRAHV